MLNNLFGPPVFGFFPEFVTVAVIIVSVITWIIRTVQGNSQQLPPPVQRPGRRREERDDEIDSFLEQVNRPQTPNRASRPSESRNQTPGTRSTKPAANVPTPAKQRQLARPLSETFPAAPASTSRPVPDSLVSRRSTVAGQDLGQGMQQHLKEYMGERMTKEAQKDLGSSLSQSSQPQSLSQPLSQTTANSTVPTNLGSFRATPPVQAAQTPAQRAGVASPEAATTARALARTDNLRQALRNPQMISQAIIVQEILSRPKALRK